MFSTKYLAAATAAFSLIASTTAGSSANLAVYWGQGPDQLSLAHYCQETSIDIIPIGFINKFPQQTGNSDPAVPAENFGNACYGLPLYDGTELYQSCPNVTEGIPVCQQLGKKVLLSLGGDSSTYQLTGAQAGEDFADYLWSAYGPYDADYVAAGGIRPFDGGRWNADGTTIDIDGFDFDIEIAPTDNAAGYIALINRLREHFTENPSKEYIISGAPQCYFPEPNMGELITKAQFDILWIQFYNNPSCSVRTWADANTDYPVTHAVHAGFNFDSHTTGSQNWVDFVSTGASAGAQLYIGLSASTAAAGASDYLSPTEAKQLITEFYDAPQFGGIMLWEATAAENNMDGGLNYYDLIKSYLVECSSLPVSSTTSSTSTTAAASTSATAVPSTTSTSATPTPTTVPSVGECTFIGCYAEPLGARALAGATFVDYELMTVELCAQNCAGYALFGVEYKGECYCGGEFNDGTDGVAPQLVPTGECSLICDGDAGEFCGGSAVLDVYQCDAILSSSSSTAAASSTASAAPSSSTAAESTTTSEAASSSTSGAASSSTSEVASSSTSEAASSSTSEAASSTTSEAASSTTTEAASSSPSSSAAASSSVIYSNSTESASPTSNTISSYSSSPSTTSTESENTTSTAAASSFSPPPYSNSSMTTSKSSSSAVGSSSILSTSSSSSAFPSSTAATSGAISSTSSSPSSTNVVSYTTSTVRETLTYTITSCAPTVTDCPGRIGSVTTQTVDLYTTVCPVTETEGSSAALSTSALATTPIPESTTEYTTSTIQTTKTYTITSCAPEITNCPGKIGSVTTETIDLYTTVCPVTATQVSQTFAPTITPSPVEYTTSTVYATSVYTITSCAPTITNCPAKIGQITTEVVIDYTTVCPVSGASATTIPGAVYQESSASPLTTDSTTHSATTLSTSLTNYATVKAQKSTATIQPVASSPAAIYEMSTMTVQPIASTPVVVASSPAAPYPTGSASSEIKAVGSGTAVGTGFPSVTLSIGKPATTSSVSPAITSVPTTFTGAGNKMSMGMGGMATIAFAALALMI